VRKVAPAVGGVSDGGMEETKTKKPRKSATSRVTRPKTEAPKVVRRKPRLSGDVMAAMGGGDHEAPSTSTSTSTPTSTPTTEVHIDEAAAESAAEIGTEPTAGPVRADVAENIVGVDVGVDVDMDGATLSPPSPPPPIAILAPPRPIPITPWLPRHL